MSLVREDLEFCHVDNWDRPVFKAKNGFYYCSVDQLMESTQPSNSEIENVLENIDAGKDELYFKGRNSNGEPDYMVKYSTR